jgi:hypothetical protein
MRYHRDPRRRRIAPVEHSLPDRFAHRDEVIRPGMDPSVGSPKQEARQSLAKQMVRLQEVLRGDGTPDTC